MLSTQTGFDPTINQIKLRSSWSSHPKTQNSATVLESFDLAIDVKFTDLPNKSSIASRFSLKSDSQLISGLKLNSKSQISPKPENSSVKELFKIQRTFKNPHALLAANLDAVTNFTDHEGGMLAMRTIGQYDFLIISNRLTENVKGFIEYLHFRRNSSIGSILLPNKITELIANLEKDRLNVVYDRKKLPEVMEHFTDGLNFVFINLRRINQLPDNLSFILTNLRESGNFLLNSDLKWISDPRFVEMLILLKSFFGRIFLFQPIVDSNPWVLFSNRNKVIDMILLEKMVKYLRNPQKFSSQVVFGLNSVKLRFWLNSRLKFIWNPEITKFKLSQNLQKLLRLWNLPDQILHEVRTIEQKQKPINRPLLSLSDSFLRLTNEDLSLTADLQLRVIDESSVVTKDERPLSPVAKSLLSTFQ